MPMDREEFRAPALTVNDYNVTSVPYRIYLWVRVVEHDRAR